MYVGEKGRLHTSLEGLAISAKAGIDIIEKRSEELVWRNFCRVLTDMTMGGEGGGDVPFFLRCWDADFSLGCRGLGLGFQFHPSHFL